MKRTKKRDIEQNTPAITEPAEAETISDVDVLDDEAILSKAQGAVEKGAKVKPLLVRSSFFIFAAHNILILHDFSHWVILHLLPFQGEWMECVDLFLRPTIAVLTCLLLYIIMEKLTPKTLTLLTGGRG